jgi:Acetyltransferases, including N-acetylases of ribosomal proteins
MKTPTLYTKQLILRPLYITDAQIIYERIGSDQDISRYMLWKLHESIDDTIEWLRYEESKHESDELYSWAFLDNKSKELIGAGCLDYNKESELYEIGYNIIKSEWGKGFATEFAREAVRFAIEDLGVSKVFGKHAIENPASGRILEKVGFVYQDDGIGYSFDGNESWMFHRYIFYK